MDYFGNGEKFNLNITYVVQHLNGKQGFATALQLVEPHISSDFCLYLADNLFGANMEQVVDMHLTNTSVVTLHIEENNLKPIQIHKHTLYLIYH